MLNIPTILTLFRILLLPFFVVAFYTPTPSAKLIAALIFILAAITDLLDGYLARKLNQTSRFGAFLDPVADKLMVATALILISNEHPGILITLPTIIIIGREITISALREWMAEIGESASVAVSMVGKVKTTIQMIALTLLIYQMDIQIFPSIQAFPTQLVGIILLYISAILTIWSMFIYLHAAWPSLKRGATEW